MAPIATPTVTRYSAPAKGQLSKTDQEKIKRAAAGIQKLKKHLDNDQCLLLAGLLFAYQKKDRNTVHGAQNAIVAHLADSVQSGGVAGSEEFAYTAMDYDLLSSVKNNRVPNKGFYSAELRIIAPHISDNMVYDITDFFVADRLMLTGQKYILAAKINASYEKIPEGEAKLECAHLMFLFDVNH